MGRIQQGTSGMWRKLVRGHVLTSIQSRLPRSFLEPPKRVPPVEMDVGST